MSRAASAATAVKNGASVPASGWAGGRAGRRAGGRVRTSGREMDGIRFSSALITPLKQPVGRSTARPSVVHRSRMAASVRHSAGVLACRSAVNGSGRILDADIGRVPADGRERRAGGGGRRTLPGGTGHTLD